MLQQCNPIASDAIPVVADVKDPRVEPVLKFDEAGGHGPGFGPRRDADGSGRGRCKCIGLCILLVKVKVRKFSGM